jgi:hypothetical protein
MLLGSFNVFNTSHPNKQNMQHPAHSWNAPTYGAKVQFADVPDSTSCINAANTRHFRTFLFYARAVDMTTLKALDTIASQQSKPTESTMKAIVQLLN